MLFRNVSGARRTFDHGPYRLTLGPGAQIEIDLPEYAEWLRHQPGIKVVGVPEPAPAQLEPRADQPKRRRPSKIVVHH